MPVSPETIQWAVTNGVSIPLLVYVAYHIKLGRISDIVEKQDHQDEMMNSIVKVLIAQARTSEAMNEKEVKDEFSPDEREVADYIEQNPDRDRTTGGLRPQQDD